MNTPPDIPTSSGTAGRAIASAVAGSIVFVPKDTP
tara:strand:- start:274 stop:378 length:105 start_codon:yes stop_codon:yes gene_type:complete